MRVGIFIVSTYRSKYTFHTCWVGRGRIALRKPSLESARCSAGELTLGELGSEVCDKEDRPRVNMLKLGRVAMIAGDGW